LDAENAAVRRENKRIDMLVWRLDHQNDPAYAGICEPLTPEEEAELFEGDDEELAWWEAEKARAAAERERVAAQGQPVGGSQSSPLRKKEPKGGAKGAGQATAVQGGSGEAKQGKSSQIKVTKGKLTMPKGGSAPEALAKAVGDARILAEMPKEGGMTNKE
jgi:hypothetical protein